MIDWAHLYGLRADIGSEAFSEVIGMFLVEADDTMDKLARPGSDIGLLLHMLKGTACAVGMTDLAMHCRDSERRVAIGAMPAIEETALAYREGREALIEGLRANNLLFRSTGAPDGLQYGNGAD